MWTWLTGNLARMANGKVLVVLLMAALPFNLFIFPYRTSQLRDISGECDPTLDSDFRYTPEKAYELFRKLKESGRQIYAWSEITVDLIFPIIYSLLFSLLIIYIFQRFSAGKSQYVLAMLPLLAMVFDYCENVLIAIMIFAYPQEHYGMARAASLFTKLKLGFLVLSAAAILFGLVYLVFKSAGKGSKAHQRRA